MLTEQAIWTILAEVTDPEIPVLTIEDLGIVRQINIDEQLGCIEVVITPTYSGCPAMNMIESEIKAALQRHHATNVEVLTVLSPAWTTDWISEAGREKLRLLGITPPQQGSTNSRISVLLGEVLSVPCPHCGATDTQLLSQFGSTACKALYRCNTCLEPFDYFKCH